MFDFNEDEVERYSRHILLQEVGVEGQAKLRESSVLVVGAGGLGSPVAYYLVAAGVGKIGIVDFDEVDLSNLQRQILHSTDDVGRAKTDSAKETLEALNPNVEIITYNQRLGTDNVEDLVSQYDIVIDGVDNFAARYLVNDACVFTNTPLVEGGILRFEGQVTLIDPEEGPCYRCVFPEPPKPGSIPSCQEAGVLGAIAGTIGTLQATEAIKYLLGIGESLIGRLVIYDALQLSFREVKIEQNSDCSLCGDKPEITELEEYTIHCSLQEND